MLRFVEVASIKGTAFKVRPCTSSDPLFKVIYFSLVLPASVIREGVFFYEHVDYSSNLGDLYHIAIFFSFLFFFVLFVAMFQRRGPEQIHN